MGSDTFRAGSIAIPVLVIARPSLLGSGGGWIAEQLGYNRTIGIFGAYFIMLGTLIAMAFPLIRFMLLVVRPFIRLGLMLRRRRLRRNASMAIA